MVWPRRDDQRCAVLEGVVEGLARAEFQAMQLKATLLLCRDQGGGEF